MNYAEKFRLIRKEKAVPQKVMAEALGVDVAVVSNIEKGKREIKLSELEIIASVFEMSVVDFVGYPQKYVAVVSDEVDPVEAVLQIKLRKNTKEQVLKLVFGDHNLEILNK